MTISEAIEAVEAIIRCYPHGGNNVADGYIGALATTLGNYPRQVARACSNPKTGIVKTAKFLPTVAEVVKWCDEVTEPLWRMAKREENLVKQIADRELQNPEMREKLQETMNEFVGAMKSRYFERTPEQEARYAELDRIEREKRRTEVIADWGDKPAPTVGGIPVSRELVEIMRSGTFDSDVEQESFAS